MEDTNDVSGVCQYKTENTDIYPTSSKGIEKKLSWFPNKIKIA